jgi:transposase
MEARRMECAQKKAIEEGYTPVFVDESGFYLLPCVRRTWAPIGQTPVLHEKAGRDHLSVISGVSLYGDLYSVVQEASFNSQGVIGFLRQLLRWIEGKVIVMWDGAPIHRSREVRHFLSNDGESAADRLLLVRLPAYAPDLNPVEGIWSYLKGVELANLCCHDFTQLHYHVQDAITRLSDKSDIIMGCVHQPGFYL